MKMPIARRSGLEARIRELEEARSEVARLQSELRSTIDARDTAERAHSAILGDRDRLVAVNARTRAEAAAQIDTMCRAVATLEATLEQANRRLDASEQRLDAAYRDVKELAGREAELRETNAIARCENEALKDKLSYTESALAETSAREKQREAEIVLAAQRHIALESQIAEEVQRTIAAEASAAALRRELASIRRVRRSTTTDGKSEQWRGYFIAFSLGRTATQWLVRVLNLHPEILATHAMDISPEKREPASGGESFLQSLERQKALSDVIGNNVDAAFDLLETAEERVVGNVHGLDALVAYEQPDNFRRDYHTSYITRHPIIRLRSLVDRWKYEIDLDEQRRFVMRQQFEETFNRKGQGAVVGEDQRQDDADWLFVHAVNYLFESEARYLRSSIPVIHYERLVSESDYLLWYLRQLTGDRLQFDQALIRSSITLPAVDVRGRTDAAAAQMYKGWPVWKRRLVDAAVEEVDTRLHYIELGYDTRF